LTNLDALIVKYRQTEVKYSDYKILKLNDNFLKVSELDEMINKVKFWVLSTATNESLAKGVKLTIEIKSAGKWKRAFNLGKNSVTYTINHDL